MDDLVRQLRKGIKHPAEAEKIMKAERTMIVAADRIELLEAILWNTCAAISVFYEAYYDAPKEPTF